LSNTIIQEKIIYLLQSTNRPGIDKVIEYLNNSDFFKAPASTKYHNSFEGGLAEHSFNVYAVLKDKVSSLFPERLSKDTVIITALLHDVCKINFYKKENKNVKKGTKLNYKGEEVPNWVEEEVWAVDDQFPYGHGEKSVYLLSKYIELTDQEAMMIRFHGGFAEPKETYMNLSNALDKVPEIILLHAADLEAAYYVERKM
jgi:hypothetical protein